MKAIAEPLAVSAGLITAAICGAVCTMQFPQDLVGGQAFLVGFAAFAGTIGIATAVTVTVWHAIDGGKP